MIQALWAKVWPYLAAIGAAFAAVLAIRQSGKAAGRQETRQEINEDQAKARKEARDVDAKIHAMDDDSIDAAMAKWVRGNKR